MPDKLSRYCQGDIQRMYRKLSFFALCVCLTAHFASQTKAERDETRQFTEQACREFALRLIEAIKSQDLDKCSGFYDVNSFVESILGDLEFHHVPKAQVLADWQQRFRESHALYHELVTSVAEGGSIEIVAVDPKNPQRNVVLRVLSADEALNYVALTLAAKDSNDFVVVDIHSAPAGSLKDLLVATVARFAPHDGPDGRIVKETPNAEQLINDKRVLASLQHLLKEGRYLDVVHNYSFLSPDVQSDRYALFLVLKASVAAVCQAAPDGEFAQALDKSVLRFADKYRKQFPDDPTVDVFLLERHSHLGKFDEAQQSINALDRWVGGDPYLDAVRARLYFQKGDVEAARVAAEESLKNCPDILPPYVAVAEIASEQGDMDRLSEVAAKASEIFGIKIREMLKQEEPATQQQ